MEQIARYEEGEYVDAVKPVVAKLVELRKKFEAMVERVEAIDKEHAGYKEFHARRLVETAGHIIIPFLLSRQAADVEEYAQSAKIYAKLAAGKVEEAYSYIMASEPEDVELFKAVETEE